MATFFSWLGKCSFFGMPHKTTITGDIYTSTMVALCENIKQKHRGKLSAVVLLLHDNAPAHKSRTSRAAIRKCGFEELNHPPYSPDLSLGDFFLFRNLKIFLRGRPFPVGNAVKKAVTAYFDTQDDSFIIYLFISEGIRSLEAKWTNGRFLERKISLCSR